MDGAVRPDAPTPTATTNKNSNNDGDERPLLARGALEDDAMSRGVQAGLTSGANTVLEFGRHESAIGHFHRQLAALLGDARPATDEAR